MTAYLISYDLNKPIQNYTGLYEKIKLYSSYLHPLDSTWLIDSNQSAKQVFNNLYEELDSSDKLLVIKVSDTWHALLTQNDYDWLHSHVD